MLSSAIVVLLFSFPAFSQIQYEQVFPTSNSLPFSDLQGVVDGSLAFSDIDGDGDEDVLITGKNALFQNVSRLYSNSDGVFTLLEDESIEGVEDGSVAFADVDGDGDEDVLVSGSVSNVERISSLYINDGSGNFDLDPNTPFDGVRFGSVGFSDIDGDSDMDVLITGLSSGGIIAKLYANDGAGNFALVMNGSFDTFFTEVTGSSIAFSDVDNDGDDDVLITGRTSFNQRTALLYANDGSGSFSLISNTPFDGVSEGSVAFSDIDNDGDEDVIITGRRTSSQRIAQLYTNDGTGVFEFSEENDFEGVERGSVAFSDIDNDGDNDLIITGRNDSLESRTTVYQNNGTGLFTEIITTSVNAVSGSSIDLSDVDGDGDQDLLITGAINTPLTEQFVAEIISELYTNDGDGNFTQVSESAFEGIRTGAIAHSDIDGDGDEDVLITGENTYSVPIAKLYSNEGSGVFSEVSQTPFEGVIQGAVAFSDVDNDGDMDVLISGAGSFGPVSNLYINDGSGVYTLATNTPFQEVEASAIAFSDVDNDGDEDVLITGRVSFAQGNTRLYVNDGSGNFTMVSGTVFPDAYSGSIAFADVDNDNDEDVLITGLSSSQRITDLFLNDGSGNFSLAESTPFVGVYASSVNFEDVDTDGDLDLFLCGGANFGPTSKLYLNDGSANFTELDTPIFEGVIFCSSAYSDMDNDGDEDLLITGRNSSDEAIAKIYVNDGAGNFEESEASLAGAETSSVIFFDMDSDGDHDAVVAGLNPVSLRTTILYRNTIFNSTTGCTDPSAENFDPNAAEDDGSCQYAQVIACDGQLGGLEDVILEEYYVDGPSDGFKTYRLFVDLAPGYKLIQVYGNQNENSGNDLYFGTSSGFYNAEVGGVTFGDELITSLIELFPDLALDTYLSLGGASFDQLGVLKSEDDDGSMLVPALTNVPSDGISPSEIDGYTLGAPAITLSLNMFLNGANINNADSIGASNGTYFNLEGGTPVGEENIVYIGQFTTDGEFEYRFNLALESPAGEEEYYVHTNSFQPDGTTARVCSQLKSSIEDPNACENFEYFLADILEDGTTNIYEVDLSGSEAALSLKGTSEIEVHIALNEDNGMIYAVSKADGSYRTFDPETGVFGPVEMLDTEVSEIVGAAFNADGKLMILSQSENAIYSVTLGANEVTVFDSYSPSLGGDIDFGSDGALYLATREGFGTFYIAIPDEIAADILVGDAPQLVTGVADTEDENLIFSHRDATTLMVREYDGTPGTPYDVTLDGETFMTFNGDLASGCADNRMELDPCDEGGDCNAVTAVYVQGTLSGGGAIDPARANPNNSLGAPEGTDELVFTSLGFGGSLTFEFDGSVPNEDGDDITVVETTFSSPGCEDYPEFADVSVSVDGEDFFYIGTVCKSDNSVDISDAEVDFDCVNFVRVANNDGLSTQAGDGFDVDGIIAIHNCDSDDEGDGEEAAMIADESTNTLSSYPNPTNGLSQAVFMTGQTQRATLEVYDMKGRLVEGLFSGVAEAGVEYRIDFDGLRLPNGVYMYRLTTDSETIIKKFIIVR